LDGQFREIGSEVLKQRLSSLIYFFPVLITPLSSVRFNQDLIQ
jgi:hypothetical protein